MHFFGIKTFWILNSCAFQKKLQLENRMCVLFHSITLHTITEKNKLSFNIPNQKRFGTSGMMIQFH